MFTNILLPTDFSDCSANAARVARNTAERFGAQVTVLHVLDEPVALDPMFRGEVPLDLLRGRMAEYAREAMASFLAAHFTDFPAVESAVATGIPYREIIRTAREGGNDLIVIGTHGRTGVEHVLFGSTAEKVVRTAPCPVLSVRGAGGNFVQP